jgi:signal peptidase I
MTLRSLDVPHTSPWLSVWLKPRQTIERIVAANPRRHVWLLASLGLICGAVVQLLLAGWGTVLRDWRAIVGIVLVGAIFGIIGLYYSGFFFRWSGKLLAALSSSHSREEKRTLGCQHRIHGPKKR